MNALDEIFQAEILVFTDATVRMGPHSLTNLIFHVEAPAIGCVCGQIIAHDYVAENQYNPSDTSTADTTIKSWAFDAAKRRMESGLYL